MIKVFLDWESSLDRNIMAHEFEVVDNPLNADIVVYQSTDRGKGIIPFEKKIYLAVEPPGANEHRNWAYSHFDDYFLVACFNPDPSKKNQIVICKEPEKWPLGWWGPEYPCQEREVTEVRKNIYWAGHTFRDKEHNLEAHGAENISHLRQEFYTEMMKFFPGSQFHIPNMGLNPGVYDGLNVNWRTAKIKEIEDSDCDFVLALEHVRYPGYISEKLMDGMVADRVPIFLGEPNIEKYVPANCFIDLRPFYVDKQIKYNELVNFINSITVEQYNEYLRNIREFRKKLFNQQDRLSADLTYRVIDYIKENYHG
jgi:hypothetical protein